MASDELEVALDRKAEERQRADRRPACARKRGSLANASFAPPCEKTRYVSRESAPSRRRGGVLALGAALGRTSHGPLASSSPSPSRRTTSRRSRRRKRSSGPHATSARARPRRPRPCAAQRQQHDGARRGRAPSRGAAGGNARVVARSHVGVTRPSGVAASNENAYEPESTCGRADARKTALKPMPLWPRRREAVSCSC